MWRHSLRTPQEEKNYFQLKWKFIFTFCKKSQLEFLSCDCWWDEKIDEGVN
jgi:hypothetical protein